MKEKLLELIKADPELLKYATELISTAEASGKIQSANTEIAAERDLLRGKIKELDDKVKAGTNTKTDDAVLNAFKTQIAELNTKIDGVVKERDTAITESRAKDLKSAVIAAAAANKVIKADDLLLIMQGRKLVGHDDKGNAFYHKINAQGQPEATTAEEAVRALRSTDPQYFAPSGPTGLGTTPATGSANTFNPMDHLMPRAA